MALWVWGTTRTRGWIRRARSCRSSTWSGVGAATTAPNGVTGWRKTSIGTSRSAEAAATAAIAVSNSPGSVSGPITTFTQVVAPEARDSARNFAWVVGATSSPSTLRSFRSMLT